MKLLSDIPKNILDIDYLREITENEPAYFGIGFIQLKLNDSTRMHFYSNNLPVLVEEPHNHRYGFYSTVLSGVLGHVIYDYKILDEGTDHTHELVSVSCNKEDKVDTLPTAVELTNADSFEVEAGSRYFLPHDKFHTISSKDNCITYLQRNPVIKQYANVIKEVDVELICPFSQPIPVGECWDIIEEMIDIANTTVASGPGYHLVDIQKGEIGEVSKIVEEALELQDAHNQGIKIMSQLEMSDLLGALDRYREKYHPDISLDDLHDMYLITRRAFANGHR